MTLLVTIHLDDFAIIASDKKEVIKLKDVVISHHENAKKIVGTGIGLITGSGYLGLLNAVKQRVAEEEIIHTGQILEIIKNERELIKNTMRYTNYQKKEFLNVTGWLLSYRTIVNKVPNLRIALYHPSIDENHFAIIEENTSRAVFPSDLIPENVEKYSNFLSHSFQKLDELSDINQNITHNVKIILDLMNEISKVSETVSKTCDIGLVFKGGDVLMTKDVSVDTPNFSFQNV